MPASPPFPLLFPLLGGFEFEKASLLSWLLAAVRVSACFDFEVRGLGAGRVRALPLGGFARRICFDSGGSCLLVVPVGGAVWVGIGSGG